MNRFLLTLLTICYGLGMLAQSNWEWTEQTSGTSVTLLDVFFINSSTGWIVGGNGTILKTTNGGDTWTPQNSGTDQELSAVHFVNENIGWATGGGLTAKPAPLLKTTDGGDTWQSLSYGFNAFTFRDLYFADENTGWLIRADSIYISTDGGESWATERFTSSVEGPLDNQAVVAVSDSVAFIAGRSKRSGTTKTATVFDRRLPQFDTPFWGTDGANQFSDTDRLNAMAFASDTVGFVGGFEGTLHRMILTDPAITNGPWSLNFDLGEDRMIRSISFGTGKVGMFNTSTQVDDVTFALVYHTQDMGETWTSTPDSIPGMLSAVLFAADDQHAWIVASGGKIFKGEPDYSSIFEHRVNILLTAYPNPSSGSFTLQAPDHEGNLDIQVVDMTGRIVEELSLVGNGKSEVEIDGAPGLYFVRAAAENGDQGVLKILVE